MMYLSMGLFWCYSLFFCFFLFTKPTMFIFMVSWSPWCFQFRLCDENTFWQSTRGNFKFCSIALKVSFEPVLTVKDNALLWYCAGYTAFLTHLLTYTDSYTEGWPWRLPVLFEHFTYTLHKNSLHCYSIISTECLTFSTKYIWSPFMSWTKVM